MEVKPETFKKATVVSRILAFTIDFALAFFISVFGSALTYRIIGNSGGKLTNAIQMQEKHVASSHLAKQTSSGFVSYTSNEYFEKTDTGYQIIDSLSYFYNIYLTGDTDKASPGDIVSDNANEPINIDGVNILPKDYYTISWFNENVLSLPKEGQTPKYDYFVYQKDGENNDYTKLGTINEKYIVDGKVEASDEMVNFVYEAYKVAATNLYNQSYMVDYASYADHVNQLTILLFRLSMILIFFEILPLSLKRGKTLGKLCMGISLCRPDGEPSKRWQVLPRSILYFLVPLILYFVNKLYLQIIIIGVIASVDLVLFIVNKKSRMIIHDYLSCTVVKEDTKEDK